MLHDYLDVFKLYCNIIKTLYFIVKNIFNFYPLFLKIK